MPTQKDFRIDHCNDCLRVTRLDIDGDLHCHLKSYKLAKVIINNICSGKIPLHSRSRTLVCMKRLSDDENYIQKIDRLLAVRKQKGGNNPTIILL